LTLNYYYESPYKIFNLPLLSVNLGQDTLQGKMRQAKGIVAVGFDVVGIIGFWEKITALFHW